MTAISIVAGGVVIMKFLTHCATNRFAHVNSVGDEDRNAQHEITDSCDRAFASSYRLSHSIFDR